MNRILSESPAHALSSEPNAINVVFMTRRQAVARVLCALGLAAGFPGVPARAEASAPASAEEEAISRMRKLHEQRKWKELVAQVKDQDFAGWPNPGEAFS